MDQSNLKTLRQIYKEEIIKRMAIFQGNKTKIAWSLGITIKSLYNNFHKFDIDLEYTPPIKKVVEAATVQEKPVNLNLPTSNINNLEG